MLLQGYNWKSSYELAFWGNQNWRECHVFKNCVEQVKFKNKLIQIVLDLHNKSVCLGKIYTRESELPFGTAKWVDKSNNSSEI